jgi:hypothetical protein
MTLVPTTNAFLRAGALAVLLSGCGPEDPSESPTEAIGDTDPTGDTAEETGTPLDTDPTDGDLREDLSCGWNGEQRLAFTCALTSEPLADTMAMGTGQARALIDAGLVECRFDATAQSCLCSARCGLTTEPDGLHCGCYPSVGEDTLPAATGSEPVVEFCDGAPGRVCCQNADDTCRCGPADATECAEDQVEVDACQPAPAPAPGTEVSDTEIIVASCDSAPWALPEPE